VTGSGTGSFAATIANAAVSNTKMANVSTATFKGRTTAGTGSPEDLTATQATALLNAVVGDSGSGGTKGLVPAPASGDAAASKFLKADGTWAVPSGGGGGSVATDTIWNAAGDLVVGTGSDTAARLAPPSKLSGSTLYYGPLGVGWIHPSTHYVYRHDLVNINNIPGDWTSLNASGDFGGVGADTGAIGILSAGTGTAINTYRHHYIGGNNQQFNLGLGRTIIEWKCRLPVLSDATDTYTAYVGMYDHQTTPVDGAWFEYSHGVNSGNWQCKVANNSSTTTTANTSVAATTSWTTFTIDANAGATDVKFYINGSLVGTETGANIPGSGRASQISYGIAKTAGSTNRRYIYADYVDVYVKY
jgi:hypothetical protein